MESKEKMMRNLVGNCFILLCRKIKTMSSLVIDIVNWKQDMPASVLKKKYFRYLSYHKL